MKELRTRKKWVEDYESAQNKYEDLEVYFEFFKEGEESQDQVNQSYQIVLEALEQLEFRNMLSSEGDDLSAVLQITAGAGGTESCDWANMLMRMYLMWAEKQGYKFVHPFDGAYTLQGSATLGLEIVNQINDMDTKIDNILISVGGGGLISGVGSLLKQYFPNINIIGIEPDEAKGITDSLQANQPLQKVYINSIADSLCAPIHMPYSFSIARQVIDEMINITDKDMSEAMIFAYNHLKLFLEPACVAGFGALKKLQHKNFKGQNTLILLCGSNIDFQSWNSLVNN